MDEMGTYATRNVSKNQVAQLVIHTGRYLYDTNSEKGGVLMRRGQEHHDGRIAKRMSI